MPAIHPLVSCLCVTKNNLPQLRRAVLCFAAQSYSNKELVIVHEGLPAKVIAWLSRRKGVRIVPVPIHPKKSLGELRNISIDHARGDYFCQWDDDDWYHRDRLEIQLQQAMTHRHTASVLMNWLIFNKKKNTAYFSTTRYWEGSVLCKRDVYPGLAYPDLSRGEDARFLTELILNYRVFPVVNAPLYIYVVHGENTWDEDHFEVIFRSSQKLSANWSREVRRILEGKYTIRKASRMLESDALRDEINYSHSYKQVLRRQIAEDLKNSLPNAPFNAVLKTVTQVNNSISVAQELGLPLHGDPVKNWDSLAALSVIVKHLSTIKNPRILDAGGETYSVILKQLQYFGFTNLICINRVFKTTRKIDGVRFQYGDVTKTKFPKNHFDAISCLSVIEHGVDAKAYFKEMFRILKPGGLLFTSMDYWRAPVNTRGQMAYGAPIVIFDQKQVQAMIEIAGGAGLELLAPLELHGKDKVVHWKEYDLKYTFLYFTLQKKRLKH